MSYKIETLIDQGIVAVSFIGENDINDFRSAREVVAQELKKNALKKILVDGTLCENKMSIFEDFEFTKKHADYFPVGTSIAIVDRPEEIERLNVVETVALNRGTNKSIFTNKSDAKDWLKRF